MNRYWRRLVVMAAVGVILFVLSGCASQMALLKGGATMSYTLQTTDYNLAFDKVVATAKESGYSVYREDRDKGFFYFSRGFGYTESTNLEVRLVKDAGGTLRLDLVASSSAGPENIINEFMTAYRRYVPTK